VGESKNMPYEGLMAVAVEFHGSTIPPTPASRIRELDSALGITEMLNPASTMHEWENTPAYFRAQLVSRFQSPCVTRHE